MESRLFIIFLALSNFAQSSLASHSIYGLSHESTITFNKIRDNQRETLAAQFNAFNAVFDIIEKLAAISIWNLEDKLDDSSYLFAKSLIQAKEAVDYTIDTIPLVVGEVCYAVETTRSVSHADLEVFYKLIPIAIGLAESKNYQQNRHEIQLIEETARKSMAHLIESIYNGIGECANTIDVDELATIEYAEKNSASTLLQAINAVFNAIKAFATGNEDSDVIKKIKYFRNQALDRLRAEVEYKFALLKAIFLNNQQVVKQLEIVNAIQYSQIVSNYRFRSGVEAIFATLECRLTGIQVGYSDSGNDDLTPYDIAADLTNAKFNAGLRVFVESLLVTNPDSSSAIEAACEYLVKYSDEISELYHNVMIFAENHRESYSEISLQIDELRYEALTINENFGCFVFDLIRNNRSRDSDIDAKVAALQEAGIKSLATLNDNIFEGIDILVNFFIENETLTEEDFSAVRIALGETNSAIEGWTYSVSAARLLLLEYDMEHPVDNSYENAPTAEEHSSSSFFDFFNFNSKKEDEKQATDQSEGKKESRNPFMAIIDAIFSSGSE